MADSSSNVFRSPRTQAEKLNQTKPGGEGSKGGYCAKCAAPSDLCECGKYEERGLPGTHGGERSKIDVPFKAS